METIEDKKQKWKDLPQDILYLLAVAVLVILLMNVITGCSWSDDMPAVSSAYYKSRNHLHEGSVHLHERSVHLHEGSVHLNGVDNRQAIQKGNLKGITSELNRKSQELKDLIHQCSLYVRADIPQKRWVDFGMTAKR
jgi:hypothetical protein